MNDSRETLPEHECPICGLLHGRPAVSSWLDVTSSVMSYQSVTSWPSVTSRRKGPASRNGQSLSNAERQRDYRQRRSQEQGQGTGRWGRSRGACTYI